MTKTTIVPTAYTELETVRNCICILTPRVHFSAVGQDYRMARATGDLTDSNTSQRIHLRNTHESRLFTNSQYSQTTADTDRTCRPVPTVRLLRVPT